MTFALAAIVAISHGWRVDFMVVVTVGWLYAAAKSEAERLPKREHVESNIDTRRTAA